MRNAEQPATMRTDCSFGSFCNVIQNLKYFSIVPTILYILYLSGIILFGTFKVLLVLFVLIFVGGPLVYKYSTTIQRHVVFLNFVNLPANPNYNDPTEYGLDGVLNFYLNTSDGVRLGVWQILSLTSSNDTSDSGDDAFDAALTNGQPIVIYNHGNSGNRAAPHRVELYKRLRKHFHVIAYDYRSYGDSSDIVPSEDGLVSDFKFIYEWLRNRTTSKIYVWGHSLGTAISTHGLSELAEEGVVPAGLVLECPFNNMRSEISEHPLSRPFKHLPWFMYTIVDPMLENKFVFASDVYIKKVNCPILILHAKDDGVVPYELGYRLYQNATSSRVPSQGKVHFYGFESKYRYGHKYICRAPDLDDLVVDLLTNLNDFHVEAAANKL